MDLSDVPRRHLTMTVWRQTRPQHDLLDFADPASYPGRYHRVGEPGVWYASSTERGAWAELFRHWQFEDVSPFEVRRRVGRAAVEELETLDLTDPDVLRQIGLDPTRLTTDDHGLCQELAGAAREARFEAILAPSAALTGEHTLVVFGAFIGKVAPGRSRVQRPPIHLLDVVHRIRLPEPAMASVGRLYEALWRLGRRIRR